LEWPVLLAADDTGMHISVAYMKKMEAADMKSSSITRFVLGSAICTIAFSASNRTALAESLEVQCRGAVRAEIKGPNCRMWMPPTITDSCNMTTHNDIPFYDNRVVECVKRGGPGRKSKT
jgi:hypothetical protein